MRACSRRRTYNTASPPSARLRTRGATCSGKGALAAAIQAVAAAATLGVAVGWIGLSALVDGQRIVELAVSDPAPLIVQDLLKLVAVITGTVLIVVLWSRLRTAASRLPGLAAGFGALAMMCLLLNAVASLWLVTPGGGDVDPATAQRMHLSIGLLGVAVVVLHGVWYLLTNLSALRQRAMPAGLAHLGIGMGLLSLLPPLGIVVLALSIWWSLWLARVLLR